MNSLVSEEVPYILPAEVTELLEKYASNQNLSYKLLQKAITSENDNSFPQKCYHLKSYLSMTSL